MCARECLRVDVLVKAKLAQGGLLNGSPHISDELFCSLCFYI